MCASHHKNVYVSCRQSSPGNVQQRLSNEQAQAQQVSEPPQTLFKVSLRQCPPGNVQWICARQHQEAQAKRDSEWEVADEVGNRGHLEAAHLLEWDLHIAQACSSDLQPQSLAIISLSRCLCASLQRGL